MANRFAKISDGFQEELIMNARLDGLIQMPAIDREKEIIVPERLVPYSKIDYCEEPNKFGVFYEDDINFTDVLENPENELCKRRIAQCMGVVSPDCSVFLNAPFIVQLMAIYRSRAIGAKFQSMGIYTIANVRWGDERTYTTSILPEPAAFLGVPKHFVVSIGSHGACKNTEVRHQFCNGLVAMLDYLEPEVVLVYGPMPKSIFGDLVNRTRFVQYDDWITAQHKGGARHGNW